MIKTLTRKVNSLSEFFHFQSRNVRFQPGNVHLQPRNVHFQSANNISREVFSHYVLGKLLFGVMYAYIPY